MDIGVKRIIDVKRTRTLLEKYLPQEERIEDDQQLLDLFQIYNKIGRDIRDEVAIHTREKFLEILSREVEKELGALLPDKPKKLIWKGLNKEKQEFLRELHIRSLEAGHSREDIAIDFQAYLVKGKKKFEVLK